jgi:hypothetical protein
LNKYITLWNSLPACPAPNPCHSGPQLAPVPGGIDFYSPFNSLDLRLTKVIRFGERQHLDLIAEAFNLFNNVNVRGFSNTSYSGRNIAINAAGGSTNPNAQFFQPVSVAGGFFGSGGPRAFQFAIRYNF